MSKVGYRQHSLEDNWDVIVIGSGMGGLSAAALLAKHGGKRVLVLERHFEAGGYTHSFHRPGYEWDVGVHYIGEVHDPSSPVRAAYDHLTGGRLRWSPMPEIYERIVLGPKTYEFVRGAGAFRDGLRSRFPAETRAIDRYLTSVARCTRSMNLFFAEKVIPAPAARLIGGLMRAPHLRWAGRNTAEVLRGLTSNAELAAVLTAQWGDYGLPPAQSSFAAHAAIAAHYLEGGYYPVGGAGQIVEAIAPEIEAFGGRIVVGAEVANVLLREGRAAGVRMADGREFQAPAVVSDAGAVNTFERLVPAGTPGIGGILANLRRLPASTSFLALYIGVQASARELGLDGGNLWVHPTPDHDANLARFIADPAAPFPLLFISFPSAKDPDFERRHPGRATVEVISPAPYEIGRAHV